MAWCGLIGVSCDWTDTFHSIKFDVTTTQIGVPAMSQEQVNRDSSEQDDQEVPAPNPGAPEGQERRAKMSEDIDDLLDEIDDVLEVNAEEFVNGFIQQGGQ